MFSRKVIFHILPVLLLVFVLLALIFVLPARAQETAPENDETCVACHEHEYYLYDKGKWFCLCDAPMHCVYCHGGRTDSSVKEVAHEGLVLYPTRDQAARCQACHTEDYMSRVVSFSALAGISSTPQAIVTATPVQLAAVRLDQQQVSSLLRFSRFEPWRLTAIGVLTLALLGVFVFGYHCWKEDCLRKTMKL